MNNTIIANYSLSSLLSTNTVDLDVNNKKIINLANPVNNQDVCNKLYVDNKVSGSNLSSFTGLNTGNLNINNYKLTNV